MGCLCCFVLCVAGWVFFVVVFFCFFVVFLGGEGLHLRLIVIRSFEALKKSM